MLEAYLYSLCVPLSAPVRLTFLTGGVTLESCIGIDPFANGFKAVLLHLVLDFLLP